MDRWSGKVALVTGAASGIGAAISRRLLDAGLVVVGLDLQVGPLEELQRQMKSFHGIECDVSREEQLELAFQRVEREIGQLQVLVNNAGVTSYTPIIESDRATFERLININVIATASCISKAVRSMRVNNVEGHIFNINSVLGHQIPEGSISRLDGINGWNLYPSSKHANVAMTHTVRREISRAGLPIRITSISPGLVKTQIANHTEQLKELFVNVPALEPTDIADALIYVLGTRPEVQITEITVQKTGEL